MNRGRSMINQRHERSGSVGTDTARTLRLLISRLCLSAATVLLLSMSTNSAAQDASSKRDCQCRAPGGVLQDLGTVQCVDIVGTKSLVRCEMSTNTPYWKKLDGVVGCPDA